MGLLALQFIVAYITIMIASGAGVMWLTNPRKAYVFHRAGVGLWWSLALGILMLLFLAMIFRWGRTSLRVFLFAALFCFIALRLGSKGFALVYFVIGTFFVQYRIRAIRFWPLLFGSALLLCSILQLVQGTADTLIDTLSYFDYFWHSARLIEGFGHRGFHFQYGAIMLSNLWYYVPRAVYPDKPFLYGLALIADWVYPGLFGVGHLRYTPGLLQWAVGYADFGVIGVVGAAAVEGLIMKGVFEYFLEHRNFVAFVLLAQLGFVYNVELFPNLPFPLFWVWFMAEAGIFWMVRALAPKASTAVTWTAG
jgi:hypothetical protein